MSLQTDIIFVKALRNAPGLIAMLPAGDVYNTAIAQPEEEALNAPLPYVIVSFDGLDNTDSTKDESYEGLTDRVTIGVEIAAESRRQVADLAVRVRCAVRDYFRAHDGDGDDPDNQLIPYSCQMQAHQVQYDSQKPCYWQHLTFLCDTEPD